MAVPRGPPRELAAFSRRVLAEAVPRGPPRGPPRGVATYWRRVPWEASAEQVASGLEPEPEAGPPAAAASAAGREAQVVDAMR